MWWPRKVHKFMLETRIINVKTETETRGVLELTSRGEITIKPDGRSLLPGGTNVEWINEGEKFKKQHNLTQVSIFLITRDGNSDTTSASLLCTI